MLSGGQNATPGPSGIGPPPIVPPFTGVMPPRKMPAGPTGSGRPVPICSWPAFSLAAPVGLSRY